MGSALPHSCPVAARLLFSVRKDRYANLRFACIQLDHESGGSDIDYLSDHKGQLVTPIARPPKPSHKFLPPFGFKPNKQFNIAHDIVAPNRQMSSASYRLALERARLLGAGMEGDEVGELLTLDDGKGILVEIKQTVPADWPGKG